MTPEQISAITAISQIVAHIGTWPIGTLLVVIVLGPYVIQFFISRAQERRLEVALKMYEKNVSLVQDYEKMASALMDTIRLSTAATTELTSFLRTRTPCHQLLSANLSAQLNLIPKEKR